MFSYNLKKVIFARDNYVTRIANRKYST